MTLCFHLRYQLQSFIYHINYNHFNERTPMKVIHKVFEPAILPKDINFLLQLAFPDTAYTISDLLFWDIETTGFSAKTSICYLIGCVYYKEGKWNYCQFFAELPEEEPLIIDQFSSILKQYTIIVHFNGDGFDIPFLNTRSQLLKVTIDFSQMIHMDLYQYAKKTHKLLKLEQYKQKNIEHFIGINRTDHFAGGDLIYVYNTFVQKKMLNEEIDNELSTLLLHNQEDICALPPLSAVIGYFMLPEMILFSTLDWTLNDTKDFTGNTVKELTFTATLPSFMPAAVSYGKEPFYIKSYDNIVKLRIKLYQGELRHFYKNYRDYYYLPSEDIAVHKSVSFYVDKNYRIQAKASTCYLRKKGIFVPQTSDFIVPEFIKNISDKTSYFEFTKDFCEDKKRSKNYVKTILKDIL